MYAIMGTKGKQVSHIKELSKQNLAKMWRGIAHKYMPIAME